MYRKMPHTELAKRLDSGQHQDTLDVFDGRTDDGTEYTIETNIIWDDRSKQRIRVMADLSTGRAGCLFGFLPIFLPDCSDGFLLASDGSFVDE